MSIRSCTCEVCKEMCRRPCWGTPADIEKIIHAGYGKRLMLYFYDKNIKDSIELLTPAQKGGEGRTLHTEYFKRHGASCTFQDKRGLCILHDRDLKPSEGRSATCAGPGALCRDEIANEWETAKGKELVLFWKQTCMKGL
jgi:hypothetical protein